jgi:hypothetical protein
MRQIFQTKYPAYNETFQCKQSYILSFFLTLKNLIAIDAPLNSELRGKQFEGLGLLPRFYLPAEKSQLRNRRRFESVGEV